MLPDNMILTSDVAGELRNFLSKNEYSRIGILVDENTFEFCFPRLKSILNNPEIIQIKSGEVHKNMETCSHIWGSLTRAGFDRASLMINLGGGTICDIGGFCAGTFMRGIDFINVPTTLLAQVDASFGGKTGVNFGNLKNQIGLFREPVATLIDTVFLETLSRRELKSGFAEVIKHSLIGDADFFNYLREQSFPSIDWNFVIRKSIEIKNGVVTQDPFEENIRKSLNFGHTVGHALESFHLENTPLLHGEAIAIGIICESFLSGQKLGLEESVLTQISALVLAHFEHQRIDPENQERIIELIMKDKKNIDGQVLMTLISELGAAEVNVVVSDEEIKNSFSYYNHLQAS